MRHYEFMLGRQLRDVYHELLTQQDTEMRMRVQVNRSN